ncbi:MAG: dihydroneopterin aldolase family protein [Methanoregulaceae archaeon]|nr:dihydroneopterin aldolase family protein [Methanoregulaceae archaeon]
MTTDREQAIFEAGIKLGALYHQWVGSPVSRSSASALETAIEKSVILQPHVEEITVVLDRELMHPNAFGYSEVQGLMFNVGIVTRVGFAYCEAGLRPKDGYPMMEIVRCLDQQKGGMER